MTVVTNRELNATANTTEEIVSLRERQKQLLVLVGELLQTNEELRQKVARLEVQDAVGSCVFPGL
jgi:hypothetical protein